MLIKMQKETTVVFFSHFVLFTLSRYYFRSFKKYKNKLSRDLQEYTLSACSIWCAVHVVRTYIFTFIFNSFRMKLHVHHILCDDEWH